MGSHAEEAAAALQREKAELLEANRILRYSVEHATSRTAYNMPRGVRPEECALQAALGRPWGRGAGGGH